MSAPATSPNNKASARPKDYTGKYVVPHPVQAGETLAKIAAAYQFKHWKPIWVYNSVIQKVVGSDPNLIKRGVTIFIPRSQEGYQRVIRGLEASQEGLETMLDQLDYMQEALKYERKASAELWNLGSDVAQLTIGLGLQAIQAVKAIKVTKHAIGQAKIAAHLSSNAQTREMIEAYAKARNRLTKQALAADRHSGASKAAFRKGRNDAVLDAVADRADEVRNAKTGDDEGALFENSVNIYKLMKLGKGLANKTLSAAEAGVETALVALDYADIDVVSDFTISLFSGQTFAEIQKQNKENATKMAQRMFEHFQSRIDSLTKERELLYGS